MNLMKNPLRKLALCAALPSLLMASVAPVRAEDTIKVGVLHSLSGTMAISETTLKKVACWAKN